MTVALNRELIENDYIVFSYGNNKRLIIVFVDEEYGLNEVSFPINTCLVYIEETLEEEVKKTKCPCVIGLGNDLMRLFSVNNALESKQLNIDNVDECQVELYE